MARDFEAELLAVIAERAGAAAAVLERVGGEVGEAARRRLGELRALPTPRRAKEIAAVLARAGSPVPPTLRAVYPDWVAAALDAEPEAKPCLAAASAASASSGEPSARAEALSPGAVWMLRRAFGGFPLTAPSAAEVEEVRAQLAWRGARALVAVLGGVGGVGGKRAAVAAALVQLGDSGELLKAAVRESDAEVGAAGAVDVGALGAATRACRGVDLRSPHALERIGAAAMGKELAAMTGAERARWRGMCWFVPRAVGMAMAALLA